MAPNADPVVTFVSANTHCAAVAAGTDCTGRADVVGVDADDDGILPVSVAVAVGVVVIGSGANPAEISAHNAASAASVPKMAAYRAALASTRFASPRSSVDDCCAKTVELPNVHSSMEHDDGICHTDGGAAVAKGTACGK